MIATGWCVGMLNLLCDRFLGICCRRRRLMERARNHSPPQNRIGMIRTRRHFVAEIVVHTFCHEQPASAILRVIWLPLPRSHHHRTLTAPSIVNHSIDGDDDSIDVWAMMFYHPVMHYCCLLYFNREIEKTKSNQLKSEWRRKKESVALPFVMPSSLSSLVPSRLSRPSLNSLNVTRLLRFGSMRFASNFALRSFNSNVVHRSSRALLSNVPNDWVSKLLNML